MLTTPDLSYQYANMILANMPSPRYKVYENSNFEDIQLGVMQYLYPITQHLGMFDLGTNIQLLF